MTQESAATAKRHDGHINAKAGVPFRIELLSASSSGYELMVRDSQPALELVEKTNVPGKGFGESSTATFTFVSTAEGTHELWIDSKRPWEDSPIESHRYEIVISA